MKYLLVLLLLLCAVPAFAQTPGPGSVVQGTVITAAGTEYPLTDWRHRLTIGATLRHHWYAEHGGDPQPQTPREFQAGLLAAYSLVPHLTLTAGYLYGFDSKVTDGYLALSVPLYEPQRKKVAR